MLYAFSSYALSPKDTRTNTSSDSPSSVSLTSLRPLTLSLSFFPHRFLLSLSEVHPRAQSSASIPPFLLSVRVRVCSSLSRFLATTRTGQIVESIDGTAPARRRDATAHYRNHSRIGCEPLMSRVRPRRRLPFDVFLYLSITLLSASLCFLSVQWHAQKADHQT